jgi:carbon storage regulator
MLVLSRKKNERIVIDVDITITVVEIRGDKVRLGIEAPKDVPVHRQEVYDAIMRGSTSRSPAPQQQAKISSHRHNGRVAVTRAGRQPQAAAKSRNGVNRQSVRTNSATAGR